MMYMNELFAFISAIVLYLILDKLINKFAMNKLDSSYHSEFKVFIRLFLNNCKGS